MGPVKGHDIYLHTHTHGLASAPRCGLAWLQACVIPPASTLRGAECWHCRCEPCYLPPFYFSSTCLFAHIAHLLLDQTSQKTLALCVTAGRFFILFLSEHKPSVYDLCLTCYFSNWSGKYQRPLCYVGMLSVRSMDSGDRTLAQLPQSPTVFFDLYTL